VEVKKETTEKKSEAQHPYMRDFWGKYNRRLSLIVITITTTIIFALMAFLWFFGIANLNPVTYVLFSAIISMILCFVTLSIMRVLSRPFHDLVHAVVVVSGEPTQITPPNPNNYGNDGFKEILQTVYEMSANNEKPEQDLKEEDTTLTAGISNMPGSLIMVDPHGKIAFHTPNAPIHQNPDDGKIIDLLFPEDDSLETWVTNVRKNKLKAERQWSRVADRLPGDKDRRVFDVAASFHKDSNAEIVLSLFDKTNDYSPEEDDLDFISFAAHELRGPITVIRGYLDVLRDELEPKLANDQMELMERLIVSSNRLTSYINNILNASRYDRRHLKLHLVEINLQKIYDSIEDDMQMRAHTQDRLLITDIPDDLPTIAADANAVGEVLSNLIDNAIKYSNEGGLVHVKAAAIPGFVEISVIDRGIGMPANVLPNLFHKFYRSHRSRETVAGTGIGLYICKAIVSSHGGTITARSVENEGTTLSFTIPIYDTVAGKLKKGHNSNESLIEHGSGWIRNHSLYRG
jgi:signal transduction histidine kinase